MLKPGFSRVWTSPGLHSHQHLGQSVRREPVECRPCTGPLHCCCLVVSHSLQEGSRRQCAQVMAEIAFSPQGWLWRSKLKRWHQHELGWRQFAVSSMREQPCQQAAAAAVSAAAWRTASTHLDGVSMGSQPGGCLASLALQPPAVESHHVSHKGAMRSLQDRRV